jgi:DNA-binding transcriptional regulator GbsR (MarR family)
MAIYVDKHTKDPEAKNGMSSQLKHYLEDEIAKKKVGKGFKENTYPIKDNFLNKEPVISENCH